MRGDQAVELKRRYSNNVNGEELETINLHISGGTLALTAQVSHVVKKMSIATPD
jgi:hypothetical protein